MQEVPVRSRGRLVGSIARIRPQLHRHCGCVRRRGPPLEARTAASTFNHQPDALAVEDAQASRRPAQKAPSFFFLCRPVSCHFQATFSEFRKTILNRPAPGVLFTTQCEVRDGRREDCPAFWTLSAQAKGISVDSRRVVSRSLETRRLDGGLSCRQRGGTSSLNLTGLECLLIHVRPVDRTTVAHVPHHSSQSVAWVPAEARLSIRWQGSDPTPAI